MSAALDDANVANDGVFGEGEGHLTAAESLVSFVERVGAVCSLPGALARSLCAFHAFLSETEKKRATRPPLAPLESERGECGANSRGPRLPASEGK